MLRFCSVSETEKRKGNVALLEGGWTQPSPTTTLLGNYALQARDSGEVQYSILLKE